VTQRDDGEPFERHGARAAGELRRASADLLADVVEMATVAADDGLPLSALLDDLRLVCDLDDGAPLPVDLVRTAALTWSDRQSALRAREVRPELEPVDEQVWALMSGQAGPGPWRAVVVPVPPGDPGPMSTSVADVVLAVFADTDALVSAPTPRHVVAVTGPGSDLSLQLPWLVRSLGSASAPATSAAPVVHELPTDPGAAADALRRLVDLLRDQP